MCSKITEAEGNVSDGEEILIQQMKGILEKQRYNARYQSGSMHIAFTLNYERNNR